MDQASERASAALPLTAEHVFPGAGEMAEKMRAMDWSRTPLGPAAQWPQSLRTAVSICLASRFPILIWWGPELVMLYNDAYRPMLGAKHPASLGAPGKRVFPEIWDVIGPMLESVWREGKATWSDDQFLPLERSGYAEECYFTFSYSPIQDETGGVGGIFCAVTETTPRVLAARRTRTARDLAAAIVDAHTADEVCVRAAGALASDVADLPLARLYLVGPGGRQMRLAASAGLAAEADVSSAELRSTLSRVARSGQPELVPFQPAAGRRLVLEDGRDLTPRRLQVLPVIEPGQGEPSAVLVAGVNPMRALDDEYQGFYELLVGHLGAGLAAAHAYEEERKRAAALAELDRAKTTFFSNVSHEFRTPLTLLLGPLEDGLSDTEDPLSPRQRERQLLARRNALRLLKLVNTLLDFSRIEAGRARAVYEPVDLAAYTGDLASAFRSVIEHAGLRFTVACEPVAEPVYVDREQWEKIVFNLLSNAFKFTLNGEIALQLRQRGKRVELEVRDTGVGIPAAEMPRLFERFHRVQNSAARTHEGSGIGLALVQELVKMHGGTITATSQPDTGTTFLVTIPTGARHLPGEHVRRAPVQAPTAVGAAAYVEEARRWLGDDAHQPPLDAALPGVVPSPLSQQVAPLVEPERAPARILVADDNADMREYLCRLLGDRGYVVEAVRDGVAALEAARERAPDLLLSDVMMPRLDGFGLMQAWRADPRLRPVPLMLLSARAGEEATVEGLAAGADDYLVKPFSAPELLARVAARLEIARAEREAVARANELETTFEAITDAIFVYDRQGRIVRTNSAARTLFGLDALPGFTDLPPERRAELVAAQDEAGHELAAEQTALTRLLRGESLTGPQALNVRLRLAGGRELDVNIAGAPLRDATGAVTGAIAISRDVTERQALERRTHEALDAVLAMAEALAEVRASEPHEAAPAQAADGHPAHPAHPVVRQVMFLTQRVLGAQYTGSLIVQQETAEVQPLAVVGLTDEIERTWWHDLSHKRLSDYFPPEWLERLYAGEPLTFDFAGQPPIPGQDYFDLTTGLVVPAWVDARRLLLVGIEGRDRPAFTPQERDLAQAAARLAALVVERERLTREREEARARALALAQANRRMDEFLSIASHELKTPVTTIKTNLDLIGRRLQRVARTTGTDAQDMPARQELLAALEGALTLTTRADRGMVRLIRLVDDLVDVSRIRAGRLELRLESCDLRALVRDCVENEQAANPGREIQLDLGDGSGGSDGTGRQPIMLVADADRVAQVVTNYLTNALKYSRAQVPVEVRVARAGALARVAVRDHGPGLPPEEREAIWEMFHRAPGVHVLAGSGIGLGLGLHICKTIIERHGGQVGVESAVGQGSTFWFTLPLADRAGE